jgi:hypothetical protein
MAGAAVPGMSAPSIEHVPVSCLVADRHPVIVARLTPPEAVSRGRVCFRAQGTPHWYYVDLRSAGEDGLWSATLPQPKATTAAVEYYLEILGPEFQNQRTPERAARVAAACDGEGAATMVSSATVAVGSLASQGPALPAGFSSAGVVSLGGAGVAAGGGVPLGVIAGGGALAAGVAGAALLASGNGSGANCPASSAAFHEIGLDCEGIQRDVRAGCALGLQMGVGRWATPEDLKQALAGQQGVIAVDGQALPVTNEGPTLHTGGTEAPGFGDRARATWTAAGGSHVATAFWTIHPENVSRCAFTVSD